MDYCLDIKLANYSNIYGKIDVINSLPFDDSQELGGNEDILLQNLIRKIKIYTKKIKGKEIISGIQLTYQNIKTKEIKELPLRKNNLKNDKDEEMEIFELNPGEYLINFFMRYEFCIDYIYQIGFETNKQRKILKGSDNGEIKNIRINGGANIILGTFGYYNQCLDSLGVLYANLNEYLKKYYIGYFELKFKIKKDEKFKKKIEDDFKKVSKEDKYLIKVCLLPDNTFNEIMKFCIF